MPIDLEDVRQHTIRDMDYLADQLRILDVTAFENEHFLRSLDRVMQALAEVNGHPNGKPCLRLITNPNETADQSRLSGFTENLPRKMK